MGGKTRLLKHLVPILNSYRKPGQHFYDVFVGGGSVIAEMTLNRQRNYLFIRKNNRLAQEIAAAPEKPDRYIKSRTKSCG